MKNVIDEGKWKYLAVECLLCYLFCRLKMSFTNRLELSVGNEILRINDDKRFVSTVPLRDRMVIT